MPAPSSAPALVGWRASLLFLFSLAALLTSCSEPTPPPPPPDSATVTLSLVEEDYTSITLKLSVTETDTATSFTLLRDGTAAMTGRLFGNDTILIDSPLLPSTGYRYQALHFRSAIIDSSTILVLRTRDTTTHNFTMASYTFGDGASTLYDVAIINDTLIMAVGQIFVKDSTGNLDPYFYNLVVWNGRQWHFERVLYQGFPASLSTIFVRNPTEVWFDTHLRWDGKSYFEVPFDTTFYGIGAKRIWGTSSGVYAVGIKGFIAYYNGWMWRRLQSGTTVDLQDVYGFYDARLREQVVLCTASNYNELSDRKILRVYGSGLVDTISWGAKRLVESVWSKDLRRIYTAGGGVFIRRRDGSWDSQEPYMPAYYSRHVRGTDENDVFISMDFGVVGHYNGSTWKTWNEPGAAVFTASAVSRKIFIAVGGRSDNKASIVMLRR